MLLMRVLSLVENGRSAQVNILILLSHLYALAPPIWRRISSVSAIQDRDWRCAERQMITELEERDTVPCM